MHMLRKRAGFNVGRFDIEIGKEKSLPTSHDFLEPAGFLLGSQMMHAKNFTCMHDARYLYHACTWFVNVSEGCLLWCLALGTGLHWSYSSRLSFMGHASSWELVAQSHKPTGSRAPVCG